MPMRLLVRAMTVLALSGAPAAAGAVLDRVKAAGTLACGVLLEPAEYGKRDIHGALDDLGRDLCKATAAAVLGSPEKATILRPTDERHGFEALQSGAIDVLFGASAELSNATDFGLRFLHPAFFDGMGLLTRRDSGIGSSADLAGRRVCFIAGTEAEVTLDAEVAARAPGLIRFPFEENGEMLAALVVGHCDVVLDSVSRLGNDRAQFHGRIKDYAVLPERLTIETMAPAIADGDPQWATAVSATLDAMLGAEAAGIDQAHAGALRTTENPELVRLASPMPGIPADIVDKAWAVRAIAAVGNFAEVYERDCGPSSQLGIERGNNNLWNRGGLMVPDALR